MAIAAEIDRASRSGCPVRVHTADGEVVVARVLAFDGCELLYAAITTNRPERYAVCDSTGFVLALEEIESAQVVREARPRRRGRPRPA
jgi:hypothetical protein